MIRRKKFFVGVRLLLVAIIATIIGTAVPAFVLIPNINSPVLTYFTYSIGLGTLIQLVALTFLNSINKEFRIALFLNIALLCSQIFMNFFNNLFVEDVIYYALLVVSYITPIITIVMYYLIIRGISEYFDLLGDTDRSRFAYSISYIFSILILISSGTNLIISILNVENILILTILSVITTLIRLAAYIVYFVLLVRSWRENR